MVAHGPKMSYLLLARFCYLYLTKIQTLRTFLFQLLFVFVAVHAFARPTGGSNDSIIKSITHETTGIELVFVSHPNMFPQNWYSNHIDPKAEPLDQNEVDRSIALIKGCFQKYPDSLLQTYLQKVYILKSLAFFGAFYGGTYSENAVYLSNKGIAHGYSKSYIEKVFHAEFSSILFNRNRQLFTDSLWHAANKKGVVYGDGGMQALKAGKSSETFISKINDKGFLNQYAQSSIENDFNAFAKNLFVPGAEFWAITSKFAGLKKKLELTVAFYHELDAEFTLEYFKSFTPKSENSDPQP